MLRENGIYYIPFWVVQAYLDTTPPEPFVQCKLLHLTKSEVISDGAAELIDTCELELPTGTVKDVPRSYVIEKSQLGKWARRFSKWFLDFAKAHGSK